jgi:tetrapyrrole methylase family protein/MazG family protein/ATP diphosphatase
MGRPFQLPESLPLGDQRGQTFPALVLLMQRLLAADGCPWDREQTFESLRRYVLEEACEVIDAIDSGDLAHLVEELGDLALQIVFLAELGRRAGAFGPDDVARGIVEKLVRRHPHVFGSETATETSDVERNWVLIKAEEKKDRPLLGDIPLSLPALDGAKRVSDRVAEVGFDWADASGAREKLGEELSELEQALETRDRAAIDHEFGDVLLALVNYGRHLEIDAEQALRRATARFRRRFAFVEERVKENDGGFPRKDGRPTSGIPPEALERYWQAAKELER